MVHVASVFFFFLASFTCHHMCDLHLCSCIWEVFVSSLLCSIPFPLLCSILLYDYTTIYLLYCRWTFGWFPVFIMNNSTMTILECLLVDIRTQISWAYNRRKLLLKKIHALQCSTQHYLQKPGHGSNVKVYQQRNC